MAICPICNGFEKIIEKCPSCGKNIEDMGRLMDFYDDYSAYMPIDQMKMEDGYPSDYRENKCPHLLSCPNCGWEGVKFIEE